MGAVLLVLVTILGLVIGSFLNVVIWRVPRGESLVSPPSHCPSCDHAVRPRDNIPVVSWVILRGRCRDCGNPISARYPAVEALTGALFALMAWHFGASWELPAYLYLCAAGVALGFIDYDTKRLPNVIVMPSYLVVAGLLTLPAALEPDWEAYLRALLGGLALFAFYFLLAVIYPAGMGMGDVKLAGVLGMALGWLGWAEVVVGGFLGFLLGGILGLVLILSRRAQRRTAIPFGPFMLVGALLGILLGQRLADWYLGLLPG